MNRLLLIVLLAVFLGGTATPTAAQDKTVTLDTVIAGYYSSSDKNPLTIQFTIENGALVAQTLWNGGVVNFTSNTPLSFTDKGMGLNVKFRRSPAGEVNEVEVNGGVWKRVKTYSGPVVPVPKQVELPPARMKPYEGLFQLSDDPARFLRIYIKDGQLCSKQEWNDGEVQYVAASDTSFFVPSAPQFWLDFGRDEKGNVVRMTRFKQEKWTRRDRRPLSDNDRKAINGIYVSKDDPDNSIQLSAEGDQVTLTQLWDNKKLVLDEQTNSYFYNAKEKYPLVLLKDDQGKITGVTVLTTSTFIRKQDTAKPASAAGGPAPAEQVVRLTEKEWKALEGYFSSTANPSLKVQFTATSEFLYAKLLWNNGDLHFFPQSPLSFVSNEKEDGEPLRITFHRDPSGEVNEVEVAGQGAWKREKDYKPDVKNEIPHTPELIRQYAGLYQASTRPEIFMRISENNNHLQTKQLWNDGSLSYFPISDSSFYSAVAPNYTLDFHRDGNGKVVGMTAFKTDQWIKKESPHYTDEGMKALSGDYISKDDPDNSIRISGKGNQITVTQLWDKKMIVLDGIADNYFYNEKESFPLLLVKDGQGHVTSVVILTQDVFTRKGSK